jgi:hypothetical protein
MFRTTMCSSGETAVFMRHLVLVILYGCLSGMSPARVHTRQASGRVHTRQASGRMHTRQAAIQNNKYQVSHKYSCFSWWWAHSHSKSVEKRNKYTKKNCAPSWLCLQDCTRMHSKKKKSSLHCPFLDYANNPCCGEKLWSFLFSSVIQLSITSHFFYVEIFSDNFLYHSFLNHILTLLNQITNVYCATQYTGSARRVLVFYLSCCFNVHA